MRKRKPSLLALTVAVLATILAHAQGASEGPQVTLIIKPAGADATLASRVVVHSGSLISYSNSKAGFNLGIIPDVESTGSNRVALKFCSVTDVETNPQPGKPLDSMEVELGEELVYDAGTVQLQIKVIKLGSDLPTGHCGIACNGVLITGAQVQSSCGSCSTS